MTNVNCLAGLACPQCGQDELIQVQMSVWGDLIDNGVAEYGESEFGDTSKAYCSECDFAGTLADFKIKED